MLFCGASEIGCWSRICSSGRADSAGHHAAAGGGEFLGGSLAVYLVTSELRPPRGESAAGRERRQSHPRSRPVCARHDRFVLPEALPGIECWCTTLACDSLSRKLRRRPRRPAAGRYFGTAGARWRFLFVVVQQDAVGRHHDYGPLTREFWRLVQISAVVDCWNRAPPAVFSPVGNCDPSAAAVNRFDNEFLRYATIPWRLGHPGPDGAVCWSVRSRTSAVLRGIQSQDRHRSRCSQVALVIASSYFDRQIFHGDRRRHARTITGPCIVFIRAPAMIVGDFSHRIEVDGRDHSPS